MIDTMNYEEFSSEVLNGLVTIKKDLTTVNNLDLGTARTLETLDVSIVGKRKDFPAYGWRVILILDPDTGEVIDVQPSVAS